MVPKRVFFCHKTSVVFWPSILHRCRPFFETKDVNHCALTHTSEKLMNFCTGVIQAPKQLKGNFGTILGNGNHIRD